ncbi:hypothetical protein OH686_22275 [Pseudomonas sp. SO81]|nr:hypothetical protein OH686_22275 [Pseudomonas sp. SO81]
MNIEAKRTAPAWGALYAPWRAAPHGMAAFYERYRQTRFPWPQARGQTAQRRAQARLARLTRPGELAHCSSVGLP